MTTQEIEQIVLSISQTLLVLNQLFMSKKMREGILKIGNNKELLQNINSNLTKINECLVILEDRLNDLINSTKVS